MPIIVENPDTVQTQMASDLYNATPSSDLPALGNGAYGIDNQVWTELIDLTRAKCKQLGIPMLGTSMRGFCIWASVVATKFFVHRNALLTSNTVRVRGTGNGSIGDHYFVVAKDGHQMVICDITSNQFSAAPDFIVGRLDAIKGTANRFNAFDGKLYDAYKVGAAARVFVV